MDLQTGNDFNDIKSPFNMQRNAPAKTVYVLSDDEVGARWALKDKKLSLSIFPIPHVKDDTPPQSGTTGGWS
jgi:hypothetical protein